jgi:hypothetical protein
MDVLATGIQRIALRLLTLSQPNVFVYGQLWR